MAIGCRVGSAVHVMARAMVPPVAQPPELGLLAELYELCSAQIVR